MRAWLVLPLVALPSTALAVPGPDSTVVVASSSVAESLELARVYARARGLPDAHVCTVPVGDQNTIDFETYEASFEAPLLRCLEDRGLTERIEAFVIARGLPIRVSISTPSGDRRAALAALLGVWQSRIVRGERLAGQPFGTEANCGGTPCYAARYRNPYTNGVFGPDFERASGGVEWKPKLVTMLHGRSYAQARMLVASATTAEAEGPTGEFVLMQGANAPRAVLDAQLPSTAQLLESLGLTATVVPFDADGQFDQPISGFVTGTQSIGDTIEANTYAPGAIVDNLTSLGAVPANFTADGETQVSIARWIARGAAGVHGCTDEPLNNVFPGRAFMVDYARGFSLAEAYLRRMPFAYWRNLVLGDPMAAPYAIRPRVTSSVDEGQFLAAGTELTFSVDDQRPMQSLVVYLNGVEFARTDGGPATLCLEDAPDGPAHLLAVAQVAPGVGNDNQPKGWTSVRFMGSGTSAPCQDPMADMGATPDMGPAPDAGPPDAGFEVDLGGVDLGSGPSDAGAIADSGEPTPVLENDNGGCSTTGTQTFGLLAVLAGGWFAARRPRRQLP